MAGAVRIGDEVTDLIKGLDRISDRLDFVVDPIELADLTCALHEAGARLDALKGRAGLASELNGLYSVTKHRKVGQYVAARTGFRAVDVNGFVNRAKWVRDFDQFHAAHGVGITEAHIDLLRRELDTDHETRTRLMQAEHQESFVFAAATCTFDDFVEVVEYWKVFGDPDGEEPKDQIESAKLSIRNGPGGRGIIKGEVDAVSRLEIETAIEAEAEKLRKADKRAGIERTAGQRRAAALVILIKRGAVRDDGTMAGPLGNIVISQTVLDWALGQLSGQDEPTDTVPVHPFDVDGRCELIDGTPIHPFLAVVALGLAGRGGVMDRNVLRRYVLDADSRLLDVSVNARSFPEWMRTAIHVQSRGRCETHGCDSPYQWLQTDHVHPVDAGGETHVGQGQAQCFGDSQAKGAQTGHTAWRDRPKPKRRRPRPRGTANSDDDGNDDGDKPGRTDPSDDPF